MFSAHTKKFSAEVEVLVKVIAKHEQIRSFIWGPNPPAEGPDLLARIKLEAPDAVAWKIFDHSAAFTRLYALFETFVFDIVEEWLKMLPNLFENYDRLPVHVKAAHRAGVGQILLKLGGDQYQHLSEEAILKGIASGVVEKGEYSLLPDAFYAETQNLWPGVLTSLLRKVGIENAWGWINHNRAMVEFIQDIRGNASSAESELNNLVQYRNQAAHGEIGEVVSVEDFSKIARFTVALSESLAQLIMWNVVTRRKATGYTQAIGQVIRNFKDKIVGVNAAGATLTVGDIVVVLRENACHYACVRSIQENNVPFLTMGTATDQKIALALTHPAKVGAEILRLHDKPTEFLGLGI